MQLKPLVDAGALPRVASHGQRLGFDEFYAAEIGRLVALAGGLAGPGVAEDVAQEAMLVAYRRWHEVRDLQRPDLWVRRTCANMAVSQFRRRVAELRAATRLAARRSEASAESLSDQSQEFWSALQALPRRQAQAAALRFIYDMPISEIAETLDCTPGTVKQHLSRARGSLALELGVSEGDGP